MLADQTVTISAATIPLPRTNQLNNTGVFTAANGEAQMTVSHTYGRRTRRAIKLQHSKTAPDPLISAQNIKHSMSCAVTFDVPLTGYTVAEAKAVYDGLIAQLQASSGAVITKVLGGEN